MNMSYIRYYRNKHFPTQSNITITKNSTKSDDAINIYIKIAKFAS
jgi:hypothetical protein